MDAQTQQNLYQPGHKGLNWPNLHIYPLVQHLMPLIFYKMGHCSCIEPNGPNSHLSQGPKTLVGFIRNPTRFFIILISPATETSKILFCRHPHGLHHHRQCRARRDSHGLYRHRLHCTETQRNSLPTPTVVQALELPASHENNLHRYPTSACNTRQEQPSLVLPRTTASPARKNLTRCFHVRRPSFGLATPQGAWVLQPCTGGSSWSGMSYGPMVSRTQAQPSALPAAASALREGFA